MKKAISSLLLLLAFALQGNAQYNLKENNTWVFGEYSGLDFNSGSPVPIQTAIDHFEASASVSDATGQLLFYSSGDTIWNRNHQKMPNAYNLMVSGIDTTSTRSCPQGTLILPVINNPNQYYVFSLEAIEDWQGTSGGRLFYSIVDMTLDGGMGDVVASQKGIILDSLITDKLTAVAGDNCNIWLLTHKVNPVIKAFEITSMGINVNPVVSNVGHLSGLIPYVGGVMIVSPNRRKIAVSGTLGIPGDKGLEICDFDPATGIASNAILLDTAKLNYGAAFSSDNSKLYSQNNSQGETRLLQYDVSLPTPSAIIASKTLIYSTTNGGLAGGGGSGQLKLGPDGKIYIASVNADSLSVISSPNLSGTACGFIYSGLPLLPGTLADMGLPSEYIKPLQDTVYTSTDTMLTAAGTLILSIPQGYFSYEWSDNSTDTFLTVTTQGTYWVTYFDYCVLRTDTFHVGWPTHVDEYSHGRTNIAIHPNPASRFINVSLSGISRPEGSFEMKDATGRTIFRSEINENSLQIDISPFAPGMYILQYVDKKDARMNMRSKVMVIR